MIAARRLYLYLVAFISLLVAAWGAAELGRALVDAVYPAAGSGRVIATGLRQDVARNGALLVVGLPLWLLHWTLAGRASRRSPGERAATLRRLYLYAVLATMVVAFASSAQNVLEAPLRAALAELTTPTPDLGRQIAIQIPWIVVAAVLWIYHRAVTASDRASAGETGGGATLRRWYAYGVAFVALMYLLASLSRIARITWETIATTTSTSSTPRGLGGAIATALVALIVWLAHWTAGAVGSDHEDRRHIASQDARSTLRPVYLFGALAVAVAFTLGGLSRLLYYALGRLLGVDSPGGVGGNLLLAMAAPATTSLVYGVAWLYQRRAIAAHAAEPPASAAPAESPGISHAGTTIGMEGVRRLYVYLVSLLAIAVLAAGAGGVLWTLADLTTAAPRAAGSSTWWREQVSLYTTLIAVGLPVWALHWGPRAARDDEAGSLARRIYLYVTLGAAVLALLGSGVAAARELLLLVLGESATTGAITNLARALSVAAVSGALIAYHLRILRRDLAAPRATVPSVAHPVAPPYQGRPYAVAYGSAGGAPRLEWFATRDEAHAASRSYSGAPNAWATVLRRDEDVAPRPSADQDSITSPPSSPPLPPASPRPPHSP